MSRHDKPIALLAALNAEEKEPSDKNGGLESVDWDEFAQLGEALERVHEDRQGEDYREVPL